MTHGTTNNKEYTIMSMPITSSVIYRQSIQYISPFYRFSLLGGLMAMPVLDLVMIELPVETFVGNVIDGSSNCLGATEGLGCSSVQAFNEPSFSFTPQWVF